MLRKSAQPHVLFVAHAPSCHEKSFGANVPTTVATTIRSMYVLGMAEEFNGSEEKREYMQFNAIYDGTAPAGGNPPPEKCLELLATKDKSISGVHFAVRGRHFGSPRYLPAIFPPS